MKKNTTKFVCKDCGYETLAWMGKCPGCLRWDSFVEEVVKDERKRQRFENKLVTNIQAKPVTFASVQMEEEHRLYTKMTEFNRVLGGGIVCGSLVLVGGDPGIGKSTLLLQVAMQIATKKTPVLYVSGEESLQQITLRARRLHVNVCDVYVYSETNLEKIESAINLQKPSLVIIDSIQTIFCDDIAATPGSVTQLRECTMRLMAIAKKVGVAIFIVGHVTKDGSIAGPKLLEHMTDAVLYFEGDRHHTHRVLRAVKNRFGSTDELGIFDMQEVGLVEVNNPSALFLEERTAQEPGSTVVVTIDGTRPMLVEVQSLVALSIFPNPRRTSAGIEPNRVALLMAVLEKRVGMLMQNQDAYLKVAGGLKLNEPAVDLGLIVSIASSYSDKSVPVTDCIVGEVGLTGEVRKVAKVDIRIKEAERMGFKRIIIPQNNMCDFKAYKIQIISVGTVKEALRVCLGK